MLYCKIYCKLQISRNYDLCLELINFAEKVGRQLNEEHTNYMSEELKEEVGYRNFKVNFGSIDCVVTMKDAKSYGAFLQKYIDYGYNIDNIVTYLNILPFQLQNQPSNSLPEDIFFLSKVNIDSIYPHHLKSCYELIIQNINDDVIESLINLDYTYKKLTSNFAAISEIADSDLIIKHADTCQKLKIYI